MKQSISYVFSAVAALLAALNGLIIAGNDLALGIKSSVPAVSAAIAALFVLFALLIWRMGTQLRRVGNEITAGSPAYRALSRLMAMAFGIIALVMLGLLYGLYDRIAHGAAIFG